MGLGGECPLILNVLGLALRCLDPDGRVSPLFKIVGRGLHVHGPDPPGQFEAVHHQLARQGRRQFVRPFVEVHVGVQAAGLLHGALVVPRGGELVERDGVRGVEAEGVEVRAADPVVFHHGVCAFGAEPQLEVLVAKIELVLAVDHGPLVQSEATKLGGPRDGSREDDAGEADGLGAVGHEPAAIEGDRNGTGGQTRGRQRAVVERSVVLPPGPLRRFRAGEDDAIARVPAQQLAGLLGVVGEEEVFHGMLLACGAPGQVRLGVALDAGVVGSLQREPFLLREVPVA